MIFNFDIKDFTDVDIRDKRILLRVDFNVDIDDKGKITDDFRIIKSIPTIQQLLKNNNRLILISHLGKPKNRDSKYSLQPAAIYLQKLLPDKKIILVDDFTDAKNKLVFDYQTSDQIILLENIRFYSEEMSNDQLFAKKLAGFADVFVNDAFGELHRSVASIVGIPKYLPSYAGLLVKDEIETLGSIISNPKRPLTFIVGGAKISTKIKFISRVINFADSLLLGGEIANTFLALSGTNVKNDLTESSNVDIGYDPTIVDVVKKIINNQANIKCRIYFPTDAVVADKNDLSNIKNISIGEIADDDDIFDLGPETIAKYQQIISQSKTVIWNGPLGFIEKQEFTAATDAIFNTIINQQDLVSIIGGGDTLTYLKQKFDVSKIIHLSIGGGAMLKFIESGSLVGLEALKSS